MNAEPNPELTRPGPSARSVEKHDHEIGMALWGKMSENGESEEKPKSRGLEGGCVLGNT